MKPNTAGQIIAFMKEAEKLCLVMRDNKLSDGAAESDSDHIFKLCFLIMMVFPYLKNRDLDLAKLLEMALVHDLVEARSGDVSQSATIANPGLAALKTVREQEAIEHFRSLLPAPLDSKIYDLWTEYEARSSAEARLVYVLDKLEAHIQANFHNDGDVRYWGECPNGGVYYEIAAGVRPTKESAYLAAIGEGILDGLEAEVLRISQENMAKRGIKVPVK